MNATNRGIRLHGMVESFEALALGFRERGLSSASADQLAYAHVLSGLGYTGDELLERVYRMFPPATRPDGAESRQDSQTPSQPTA